MFRVICSLPPNEVKPNARCHHMKKANAVSKYRALCKESGIIAKLAVDLPKPFESPLVGAIFYLEKRYRCDGDNLLASLKPCFDGLQDAGIWQNDRSCVHLPVKQGCDKLRPRVEIYIQESDDDLWKLCGMGDLMGSLDG